jgi:hypothetical protein
MLRKDAYIKIAMPIFYYWDTDISHMYSTLLWFTSLAEPIQPPFSLSTLMFSWLDFTGLTALTELPPPGDTVSLTVRSVVKVVKFLMHGNHSISHVSFIMLFTLLLEEVNFMIL